MVKISQEELNAILERHSKWLHQQSEGCRADLSNVDLSKADLSFANLCEADLCGTNLSKADLHGANLRDAYLYGANLSFTYLDGVDLSFANLNFANLRGADFGKADLSYANFRGADLYDADLSNAINAPYVPMACPETGSFIGFKKARGKYIVKLEITEDAKRCSATTEKCRCNKAKVLEIQNLHGSMSRVRSVKSLYDKNFIYRVGEIVEVPDFDENRWNVCSNGIHFFINRQDAVNY